MKQIIAKRRQFLIGLILCLGLAIVTNLSSVGQFCLQTLGSASCLFANAANPTLPATGTNGAVVSTSRDASIVGLEVLKDGGKIGRAHV